MNKIMDQGEFDRLQGFYARASDLDVVRAYSTGPEGVREQWIWEIVSVEHARRAQATSCEVGDQVHFAERVASYLHKSFPTLTTTIEYPPPEGMLWSLSIPVQPTLSFEMHLNLQNDDELHLVAGGLWVSWFPCLQAAVATSYFEAIEGLLAGRFRILQRRRDTQVIGAELQRPVDQHWERITGCWYAPPLTGVWLPQSELIHSVLQNSAPVSAS